jgi:hypothetical protein
MARCHTTTKCLLGEREISSLLITISHRRRIIIFTKDDSSDRRSAQLASLQFTPVQGERESSSDDLLLLY